jgi:putative ABC transport system permease protein
MFKVTLAMMRRNLKMLILAGIAIIIGTAFISSTFLFANSLQKSLTESVSLPYRGATHELYSPNPTEKSVAPTLGNILQLEKKNMISDWRLNESDFAYVSKGSNKTIGQVVPMASSPSLMPSRLVSGSWPHTGQVAVSSIIADGLHLKVGDRVTPYNTTCGAFFPRGSQCVSPQLTVSGILHDEDTTSQAMGGSIVFSMPDYAAFEQLTSKQMDLLDSENESVAAQGATFASTHPYAPLTRDQLEKSTEGVTDVMLTLHSSQKPSSVMEELKANGVREYRIRTAREGEEQVIKDQAGGKNVVQIFLLIFGVLALLVAGIVISNTFQVIIAQRRRNLALLRAVGAKRSQLYHSVITESLLLGLISSVIGVIVAFVVAVCMQLGHVGIGVGTSAQFYFVPDASSILVPLIFGTLITVLASLSSARLATSVTPLEALRPMTHVDSKKAGAARGVVSVLLLLGSLLCISYVSLNINKTVGTAGSGNNQTADTFTLLLSLAILGCALLFIAIVISAVWWIPWTLKGVGALVRHIGPASHIAAANVVRNRRRVAATGVALLIGVTLVTTISTGAATFKSTTGAMADRKYTVDLILDGAIDDSGRTGSSASHVLSQVRQMKGVEHAQAVDQIVFPTESKVEIPGSSTSKPTQQTLNVYAISSTARQQVMRTKGFVPADSAHKVLVTGQSKKDIQHWKNGDAFVLHFSTNGQKPVTRSLTFEKRNFTIPNAQVINMGDTSLTAVVDPSVFEGLPAGAIHRDTQVWVRIADGADGMAVINSIRNKFGSNAQVYGPWAERKEMNDAINQIMLVMIGLLAVSVIIALIGVANTLSLSVIERAREIATLRAIGMTRSQLRRSLLIEALLISVSASIAGVILGSFFGWFGSWVVITPTTGNMVFSIDWGITGAIIVISLLAALISSVAPAHRALKTSPVEVLSEP